MTDPEYAADGMRVQRGVVFNRILMLGDDTERILAAVEAARELARPTDGPVTLLCLLSAVSDVPLTDLRATFSMPGQIRLNAETAADEALAKKNARRAQLEGVRCSGTIGTGEHEMASVLNAAEDDASDVVMLARPRVLAANQAQGTSLIDQLLVHSPIPMLLA